MNIPNDLAPYLTASELIDSEHPAIVAKARELAAALTSDAIIARASFRFVRDAIRHSVDFKQNPVTMSASEALAQGTGFCFAKAHLLVALLRANGIPAGLCYQRLLVDAAVDPGRYCLHGLVALHLKEHGWYRIDPRGNKKGVEARFKPPISTIAARVAVVIGVHPPSFPFP